MTKFSAKQFDSIKLRNWLPRYSPYSSRTYNYINLHNIYGAFFFFLLGTFSIYLCPNSREVLFLISYWMELESTEWSQ